MEESLQHDPRTKSQIKDILYAFLYAPVQKKFKTRLDTLITRNTSLTGASHNSFIYKDNLYSCDAGKLPRKLTRLVSQLHPQMDEYLKDQKTLNDIEISYVVGFITTVLNASNDLQDYLRVFPESVHRPIEQLIASCPCRNKKLTEFDVSCMQKKHQTTIDLIKQRMVLNLLI